MHGSERQPASRQMFMDLANIEGQKLIAANKDTFKARDRLCKLGDDMVCAWLRHSVAFVNSRVPSRSKASMFYICSFLECESTGRFSGG